MSNSWVLFGVFWALFALAAVLPRSIRVLRIWTVLLFACAILLILSLDLPAVAVVVVSSLATEAIAMGYPYWKFYTVQRMIQRVAAGKRPLRSVFSVMLEFDMEGRKVPPTVVVRLRPHLPGWVAEDRLLRMAALGPIGPMVDDEINRLLDLSPVPVTEPSIDVTWEI